MKMVWNSCENASDADDDALKTFGEGEATNVEWKWLMLVANECSALASVVSAEGDTAAAAAAAGDSYNNAADDTGGYYHDDNDGDDNAADDTGDDDHGGDDYDNAAGDTGDDDGNAADDSGDDDNNAAAAAAAADDDNDDDDDDQVSPDDAEQGQAAAPEGGGDDAGRGQRAAQNEHTGKQAQGIYFTWPQAALFVLNNHILFREGWTSFIHHLTTSRPCLHWTITFCFVRDEFHLYITWPQADPLCTEESQYVSWEINFILRNSVMFRVNLVCAKVWCVFQESFVVWQRVNCCFRRAVLCALE